MGPPRFRITLLQMIALIAACTVLLAMIRGALWPLVAAIVIVMLGFAIDRARGGPGILGAMLAGVLGFSAFGVERASAGGRLP